MVYGPFNDAEAWIETHLSLVDAIAAAHYRHVPRTIELQDLRQAGRLGLVIAARHPGKPPDAGTDWASRWIRAEIRNFLVGRAHRAAGEMGYAIHRVDLSERTDHAQALAAYQEAAAKMDDLKVHEAVEHAKEGLSERQRDLLDLVYEHGQSLRAIGTSHTIGIGIRQVTSEYRKALTRLRKRLDAAGFKAA